MTLVPLQLRGDHSLQSNKVNFISLTPGTTFNLRSTTGITRRTRTTRTPAGAVRPVHAALRNALPGGRGRGRLGLAASTRCRLRASISRIVRPLPDGGREGREAIRRAGGGLPAVRRVVGRATRTRPRRPQRFVGELEEALSHACVRALKPDLIIMDEFQRFRDLLRGDGDAADLARELFDYGDGSHAARDAAAVGDSLPDADPVGRQAR